jgi:hypothetical protein
VEPGPGGKGSKEPEEKEKKEKFGNIFFPPGKEKKPGE